MDLSLAQIAHCFHGVVPALMATASRAGEPNVTFLSHVYLVDAEHVALSCQFFNKTRVNVAENPVVCVEVNDPFTFQAYRMELRFCRSETSGPLFERMRERLDTIAFHTGMQGVFRLLSADVYEVLSLQLVEGYLVGELDSGVPSAPDPNGPMTEIRRLQLVSSRINAARSLDELFEGSLAVLEEALGFAHSMLLMLDETGQTLFTVASRGYGDSGIGAEVELGAGLIGRAAAQRQVTRAAGLSSDLRYGRAIREQVSRLSSEPMRPEVPLPGLKDAQSQMALPLVVGAQLLGVLALESTRPVRFEHWHTDFLDIITNQLALAIDRMAFRDESAGRTGSDPELTTGVRPVRNFDPTTARKDEGGDKPAFRATPELAHVFWFFPNDDCVFVNGEYLVRNLPGRILWRLLSDFHRVGRREFTNRELRLDQSLGLPPIKDNLESRLILLRRRLEEKCPQVRLVPIRRGRFGLEVTGQLELIERSGAA
jgi:hypothetical protein